MVDSGEWQVVVTCSKQHGLDVQFLQHVEERYGAAAVVFVWYCDDGGVTRFEHGGGPMESQGVLSPFVHHERGRYWIQPAGKQSDRRPRW